MNKCNSDPSVRIFRVPSQTAVLVWLWVRLRQAGWSEATDVGPVPAMPLARSAHGTLADTSEHDGGSAR